MNSLFLSFQSRLSGLFPGLIVVGTIAAAAGFLSLHYKAPVMLFALLIGIAFNFLSTDERCAPGIEFSSKKILRFGVALLGFRVTFDQILGLGTNVLLLVPILVISSIAISWLIAKLMGRRYLFGLLTACLFQFVERLLLLLWHLFYQIGRIGIAIHCLWLCASLACQRLQ